MVATEAGQVQSLLAHLYYFLFLSWAAIRNLLETSKTEVLQMSSAIELFQGNFELDFLKQVNLEMEVLKMRKIQNEEAQN